MFLPDVYKWLQDGKPVGRQEKRTSNVYKRNSDTYELFSYFSVFIYIRTRKYQKPIEPRNTIRTNRKTCNSSFPCWCPLGWSPALPPRWWWTPRKQILLFSGKKNSYHSFQTKEGKGNKKCTALLQSIIQSAWKPFPVFSRMPPSLQLRRCRRSRSRDSGCPEHWTCSMAFLTIFEVLLRKVDVIDLLF